MDRVALQQISIADFRNFHRVSLTPHPRFNVIHGANGMGKTNLLEAIYMLSALRSFRTSVRRELLRHGAELGRVAGGFEHSAGFACEVALSADSRRVKINEKALGSVADHFRQLPMVLFHPSNMDLVQRGPQARRRLIDRALFQIEPGYPSVFKDYAKTLANRNKLLKEPILDRGVLRAYTQTLAELGSRLVQSRARFIHVLRPLFNRAFSTISGGQRAALNYEPSIAGDSNAFLEQLAQQMDRDIARRFTTAGPHADDLEISIEGRSARKFASQGQQRSAVLALKIAKTRALTRLTHKVPLLLLDDVSSELDRGRNRKLFEFMSKVGGQVFVTTTHLDHILIKRNRFDIKIEHGKIVEP